MQIPQRLAYILERDQELDGAVKLSVTQLEPWINNSNLPFFPEYTKHDLGHIEAVLRTAVSLVQDEAWEAMTPSDAGVLVLAVLLHDCAMHLLEDGFISLLEPSRSARFVPGMNDKPWNLLWEEFCGEASRFDGRTLMRIFGETAPIRRPLLDPERMTKRDRLLIGEFVRRHHPRLAQEIAFFGVPTLGDRPLAFRGLSESKSYIAALSGIIARSHGADVRSFLPYLREHFDIRQYKGVHAVFLMTLLRVADYVQIDAERAPAQVLQVKRLASPVSQGEWKAHHAIRDIRHTHEDPEALFIDALPEDAQTFFRVESWVKGIQQELDDSWAVLGEVYGRYEGLSRLGLVLRRIRSTLDNIGEISEKLPYLPIRATFRGSDADLLKLLIEPLYGNRPEIGIRELIQNAVDAVRELSQYVQDVPSMGDVPVTTQEADVIVSVSKDEHEQNWISVSDKGIGMTAEIIVDFFLTAGASFRRTEQWKKMFERTDGRSRVLRAGRFGVGALASFLLGPELQVSTRHVEEAEGIAFSASVETEFIELRRFSRPVGTTIRIRVSDELVEKLQENDYYAEDSMDWDWYCLSKPTVKRLMNSTPLTQEYFLPNSGETLPPDWRRISHPDFEDVLWTYSHAPELVCNGIKVQTGDMMQDPQPESEWDRRFGLRMPNVSVFDPDGRLPLNLQRTGYADERYPFDDVLADDVIRDFIAHSLVYGPTGMTLTKTEPMVTYPGLVRKRIRGSYLGIYSHPRQIWYFTNSGFGLLDASLIQTSGANSVLIARLAEEDDVEDLEQMASGPKIITESDYYSVAEADQWLRNMIEYGASLNDPLIELDEFAPDEDERNWGLGGEHVISFLPCDGARILVPVTTWRRIVQSSRIRKNLRELLTQEWEENGWHLFQVGNCPECMFDFSSFASKSGPDRNAAVSEIYFATNDSVEPSPMGSGWLRVLRTTEIPYDIALRRQKLKHAYEELQSYINAHEAEKSSSRDSSRKKR
jgi:signal transduction histidine kinase